LAARPKVGPVEVPPALVGRRHCAVGRSLGFVVFPQQTVRDTVQRPSSAFPRAWPSSRVLPSTTCSAGRGRRTLSQAPFPCSTYRNRPSTCRGLCLPASFRLQGLATLVTAFSRQFRVGFVSRRQRSWDFPFGAFSSHRVTSAFPRRWTRVPFAVRPETVAETTARKAGARFPGFDPCGNPYRDGLCLAVRRDGCSPGLRPSRVLHYRLGRAYTQPPPTRLAISTGEPAESACATEFRSATAWRRPKSRGKPRSRADTTRLGFLHRLDPDREDETPPGLFVHLAARRALPSTVRRSLGCMFARP
jgi:hypothetical protein